MLPLTKLVITEYVCDLKLIFRMNKFIEMYLNLDWHTVKGEVCIGRAETHGLGLEQ